MTTLRLYAPVIVLLAFAVMRWAGLSLSGLALIILAVAVYAHIRTEASIYRR